MWSVIVGVLAGPFRKIAIYGAMILVAVAILVGGYFLWRHHIRQDALEDFNRAQLEQTIKDKEKLELDLKAIHDKQDALLVELAQQKEELQKKVDELDKFLSSPETIKQDRPASNILKETIRRLK